MDWKELEKEIVIHNNKMNIVESMERFSISSPEKIALHLENEKTEKLTYKELFEKVNQFANLLTASGVKKGDKVALFLPKCAEMYYCFLGTIKTGAIAMPLFEAFQEEGLELRLKRGDVKFLVTNNELRQRYEKISEKPKTINQIFEIDNEKFKKEMNSQNKKFSPILLDKKETAIMIFTSSTAGTPVAGIELPHYSLIQQNYTAKVVLDLKKEDNYWCTAHPAWITGAVYGVIAPLSIGCSIYVIEGRFEPSNWINFMKNNNINKIYTAPTALRLLKPEIKKSDFEKVKRICSVGEALPESLVEFYRKKGVNIIDTYWQTEIGSIVIANLDNKKRALGKAIGVNIKIKDGMAEIETPWPSMMTSIYKHEQMYKDYFDGSWFKTNDLMEKKGEYFYFSGRKDDIIKTSGERVSPLEIENILLEHPSVKESAVIGIPDKIRGSLIKAFIVLNSNFKKSEELKQEIGQFVKSKYAGHAYPKVIEFVDSIPKNNAGKIVRMALRKK